MRKYDKQAKFLSKSNTKIVYSSYGENVGRASHRLKNSNSARARMEFLNNYNDVINDEKILVVFKHCKGIFLDVYELRNSLCHDTWFSAHQFSGKLLLSSMDEEARLLFALGKLTHVKGTTSRHTFDAILRFISNVKIVSLDLMRRALSDIVLCNWCLMQIDFIINEDDIEKVKELKRAFLIFNGTSHLFPGEEREEGRIEWQSRREHSVDI